MARFQTAPKCSLPPTTKQYPSNHRLTHPRQVSHDHDSRRGSPLNFAFSEPDEKTKRCGDAIASVLQGGSKAEEHGFVPNVPFEGWTGETEAIREPECAY